MPQKKQEAFFLAKTAHIGYGGARGGGKSWAMRRKFVLLALRYPKLKLLLLRRTMPELRNNHIRPLLAELDGFARYNDSEKTFFFPNGSFIQLGYCDHEKDVYQYQGQEYDVIGFEEATQFTEYMKDFIATSNRTTRTDFKPRIYYTANPGGVGHAWFKRLFIDKEYKNDEIPEEYVFISARVYDNDALMNADPGYVRKLKNLPDDLRKAFLDGNWDIFAGQFFSEWRAEKHICKPFPIPDHWRKWRSIDWGYKDSTAVYWYASDEDGRVYVYRELYINQTLGTEVARQVRKLTQEEDVRYTVAGHDMWQKRGHDFNEGENIAETFNAEGVYVEKADISRIVGWNRVREYLADASDGIPHVQVFESCVNLIRTLPTMVYDERRAEDMADGMEDHAADSFRYGLMSRPIKSQRLKEDEPFIARHKKKAIERLKKVTKRVL